MACRRNHRSVSRSSKACCGYMHVLHQEPLNSLIPPASKFSQDHCLAISLALPQPKYFFEQNCGGVPHSIKNNFIKKERAEAKDQSVLQNVQLKASSQKQKADLRSALNLTDWRRHCYLKLQNQELQEATCLSKILSFLIFQSSQLSMRVASVKNSASLLCFASKSLSSKLRERFQLMLIFAQHCLAKGHVKNRWLIVSAAPVLHITQSSSL